MKKLSAILLILSLCLALASCGGAPAAEKTVDMAALDSELQGAGLFTVEMKPANEKMMSSVVKLDMSDVENYVYYICGEYTGEEYGLFKCASEDAAKELEAALKTRVESLKTTYEDYAAEAMPRIENALVSRSGSYVGMIIAEENNKAAEIFGKYFK